MQGQPARCRKCHRKLKNAEAILVGYGPVCYRRLFGAGLPTPLANLEEKMLKSFRPRKAAGHQISFFEIEEENHATDNEQAAR